MFKRVGALLAVSSSSDEPKKSTQPPFERIRRAERLVVPTAELLVNSGFDASLLRSYQAIVQPSASPLYRCCLVTSDPLNTAIGQFERLGIEVRTASAADINYLWTQYARCHDRKSTRLSREQAIAVLTQLAIDALACSASEAFIGGALRNKYEFVAAGCRYSGSVHENFSDSLFQLLASEGRLNKDFKTGPLRSFSAGVSRYGGLMVCCLSWEAAIDPRPIAAPIAKREKTNHILLVDDDDRFSLLLSHVLKEKSFSVTRCANGLQALDFLKHYCPALIICDIHMPQLDGSQFMKRLRQFDAEQPVIILTSDSDQLLEAELAMLGANAFVRKDDDLRVLLAWCHSLWQNSEQQDRATSAPGGPDCL